MFVEFLPSLCSTLKMPLTTRDLYLQLKEFHCFQPITVLFASQQKNSTQSPKKGILYQSPLARRIPVFSPLSPKNSPIFTHNYDELFYFELDTLRSSLFLPLPFNNSTKPSYNRFKLRAAGQSVSVRLKQNAVYFAVHENCTKQISINRVDRT